MHCEKLSNAAVKNTNIAEHVKLNIIVEYVLHEGSVKRHSEWNAVIGISAKSLMTF